MENIAIDETLRNLVLIGHLVGNIGFPVVVAGFLLWKVLPALTALSDAIAKATVLLERIDRDFDRRK